jgi:hypothetical protein
VNSSLLADNLLSIRFSRIISLYSFLILISLQIGCERPTDNNQTDDGIPPAIPTGVQIYYASDGEIIIDWNNNSDADLKGYKIYRKIDDNVYTHLAFTTNNYWIDDSLSYDETYFYSISAIDIWGEESQRSSEVSAKPMNRYKPQKPRYIIINARNWEGKMSVFLSWEPNKETDIAGYNIYRSLNYNFTADSTTIIYFVKDIQFNDTNNIQLYVNYYYKIRAVDKGNLLSEESSVSSDQVMEMARQIFPSDDSFLNYFDYFLIKTIKIPAEYRILVQTNEFYGVHWQTDFSSSIVDDTIQVSFDPPYLEPYIYYYWRVITFSPNSSEPNSISPLYKFKVKP